MAKQNAMLLLLFLGLFTATISSAHAMAISKPICVVAGVALNITACKPIILNKNLTAGSLPECCANLGTVKVIEAILGPQTTSQCVQAQLSTSTSVVQRPTAAVDDGVSTELQVECGVNLGFSVGIDVYC